MLRDNLLKSILGTCFLTTVWTASLRSEPITYRLDFDSPMSWADDVVFWGMGGVQRWEVYRDDDRSVLRIDGSYNRTHANNELRTIQISHEPGAPAAISFDIKAVHLPPGATFTLRHFDGYCTGLPFREIADEAFAPFPRPLITIGDDMPAGEWRRIEVQTGPLEHTVLTLAFHVRQVPPPAGEKDPGFVQLHLDNLRITTQALSRLMDPGFDWHGVYSSTRHLKASTLAKASDWCDYAEQVDEKGPEGQITHFTLLALRDTASHKGSIAKHNFWRMVSHDGVGGRSVISLDRESSGGFNAVSWGVRQTVGYSAVGFDPGEAGKVRVTMRLANDDDKLLGVSRVQLGVDPNGGISTRNATWSEEVRDNVLKEGWRTISLEFERPRNATAFTVYFRHRDGLPRDPEFVMKQPEPQSMGSRFGSKGMADWVLVEKLP